MQYFGQNNSCIMREENLDILVVPWLQNSPKPKIIHGISGITTQHLVPKEKSHHKIQYSLQNSNKSLKAEIPCKYWGNRLFPLLFDTNLILKTILKFIGYFIPFVWEQVRISVQRGLYFLMSEPVGNSQRRESQFYQKTCV